MTTTTTMMMKRPSPAEQLDRMKREVIKQAEEEGLGELTGIVVLGREIVYSFGRRKIVRSMPSGSTYPRRSEETYSCEHTPLADGILGGRQ